jgi:aminoglycoside phosphotransferase family enzyme/gluconate kinase
MTFDISSMLSPEVYDHPVESIELVETHISWVLLTGEFAYKIKKPVNFGFLDFSSLEKRRTCCEYELRLNRRLAPDIYLDVVSISGTYKKPVISSHAEAFEYAVKMVQFPQSSQLDHMLAAGELKLEHIEAIAAMAANFHQIAQVADSSMHYGNKEVVYHPVEENFQQIREHMDIDSYKDQLNVLRHWSEAEYAKLEKVFEQRKHHGFVRECHGDMHLRNLVWFKNKPMAFDCIEFNADLRWIDVISEVAFLIMDLQDRQQRELSHRFLNSYLEITGDYSGLSVLSFYLCYRALVRAKVDALRVEQKNITQKERMDTISEFESYLELATGYTKQPMPRLLIMHGLSASGKSTVSQHVVDAIGAIRIRSDVERKRLFGVGLDDNSSSEINVGIYSSRASQETYEKLHDLASEVIRSGCSVIVDAAFLKHEQRELFQKLAEDSGAAYIILEATAPEDVLRQRIVEREHDVSDADLSVLEYQLSNWEPLRESETGNTISIDTSEALNANSLVDEINALT